MRELLTWILFGSLCGFAGWLVERVKRESIIGASLAVGSSLAGTFVEHDRRLKRIRARGNAAQHAEGSATMEGTAT